MTNKTIILGSGVFIIALATLFVFLAINIDQEQSVYGFSTLSLTKTDLRSDSQYLNGEVWMMTVRQGGLSQRAEGTFGPEDVSDKNSGEETTTKDFEILINYEDQQCVYPIERAGLPTPIYKMALHEWGCLLAPSEAKVLKEFDDAGLESSQLLPGGSYFGKYSISSTCFAMYWEQKTPVGIFGKTDIRSQMEVALNVGSSGDSRKLDTEGSTQGNIGDFGYVIWQGNLDTGKSCSYTTTMPFRPAYYNGRWRVVSENDYTQYLSKFLNRPSSASKSDIRGWVDELSTYTSRALVSESFGKLDDSTSYDSAVLRETIQSPNQYPVITLYIKADKLGIYTPTPKIKLSNADSECFKTGQEGIIEFIAKNIGDETGTWNFYGDCDSGSFDIVQSREYSVQAGKSRTITLPLSAEADQKKTSKCTVYAESPAGVESLRVNVCVDPLQTCVPDKKFCGTSGGFDVVRKCSSDGATSSIFENCASGDVCEGGKCIDEDNPGDPTIWSEFMDKINDFINKFRWGFAGLIAILAGVLGFFVTIAIIERFNLPPNKVLPWVMSLSLALILGFLAYLFFWVAIIALIIFLIIKFVL